MQNIKEETKDLTCYVDNSYVLRCEHNHRFYFFMNHSRWLCQIRRWNTDLAVWELIDVIKDVNDNSDGYVEERINRVCD